MRSCSLFNIFQKISFIYWNNLIWSLSFNDNLSLNNNWSLNDNLSLSLYKVFRLRWFTKKNPLKVNHSSFQRQGSRVYLWPCDEAMNGLGTPGVVRMAIYITVCDLCFVFRFKYDLYDISCATIINNKVISAKPNDPTQCQIPWLLLSVVISRISHVKNCANDILLKEVWRKEREKKKIHKQ